MSHDRFQVQFPLHDFLPLVNSTQSVTEPERAVPVLTECDVAVFGGGPAGICAAAARAGRHVVLVERYGFLGGMATAANVTIWHSLYGTDGAAKVIGGLPEEIIRRLQQTKAIYNLQDDGETGPWVIGTETAKLVFDDIVIGSGVRLLLHTQLAGVLRNGGQVTAALVEGKSGRQAILAKVFIDCTGDADLVRRSGVATQLGNADGACQAPTLCWRMSGVKTGQIDLHQVQAGLFHSTMEYNGEPYPTFLWGSHGVFSAAEYMLAGTRVLNVNAADALSLTRAEVEARYQMRWVMDRLREQPGWDEAYLSDIATQIGVRESHRIHAEHELQRDEVLHGVRFADTVAQGTYPIDIHCPDGPGITFLNLDGTQRVIAGDRSTHCSRWDGRGEADPLQTTLCYCVPYRSLVPRGLKNVLAAGRCIGASHESAGAIRVMVNCMQLGEAAGTAAALAGDNCQMRDVPATALRDALLSSGVPLLPVD